MFASILPWPGHAWWLEALTAILLVPTTVQLDRHHDSIFRFRIRQRLLEIQEHGALLNALREVDPRADQTRNDHCIVLGVVDSWSIMGSTVKVANGGNFIVAGSARREPWRLSRNICFSFMSSPPPTRSQKIANVPAGTQHA